MTNLNIAEFNPIKERVYKLVENIKATAISIPDGTTGYELLRENKIALRDERLEDVALLKAKREGALKFQRDVISVEKEILGMIEPLEKKIDAKIKEIDEARKREERKEMLPERIERLATLDVIVDTEEFIDTLLGMDEKQFAEFFIDARQKFVEEKERKLEEKKQRIEDERIAKEEANKKAEADRLAKEKLEKALKQAEEEAAKRTLEEAGKKAEEARNKAEKDKQEAVEAEQRKAKEAADKAAAEKQAIIDENNRKELARLQEEEDKRRTEEARIKKETEEKARLENEVKYIKFLNDNGCNEKTKVDFLPVREGGKVILYKKIAEYVN